MFIHVDTISNWKILKALLPVKDPEPERQAQSSQCSKHFHVVWRPWPIQKYPEHQNWAVPLIKRSPSTHQPTLSKGWKLQKNLLKHKGCIFTWHVIPRCASGSFSSKYFWDLLGLDDIRWPSSQSHTNTAKKSEQNARERTSQQQAIDTHTHTHTACPDKGSLSLGWRHLHLCTYRHGLIPSP